MSYSIEKNIYCLITNGLNDESIQIIHHLLTSNKIDYNYIVEENEYASHTLRDVIGCLDNEILLKDMLGDSSNRREIYEYNNKFRYLCDICFLCGEYENAIDEFLKGYDQDKDLFFTGFDDDFNKYGYTFPNSNDNINKHCCFEDFITIMGYSFGRLDKNKIKDLIIRLLSSEKIKYIELSELNRLLSSINLPPECINEILELLINSPRLKYIERVFDKNTGKEIIVEVLQENIDDFLYFNQAKCYCLINNI